MNRFVLISNPESPRTSGFQDALLELGHRPALVVPWLDVIEGRARLETILRPGDSLRIESPGRNFLVERALLIRGADEPEPESERKYAGISADEARNLEFQKGEILYPRQWYLGFCAILRDITTALAQAPDIRVMSDPNEIAALFDKYQCQLDLSHISAPRPMGIASSYSDVWAAMYDCGTTRVFAKLTHGSSASGIVAYRYDGTGDRFQAFTTVEWGRRRMFNSRRVECMDEWEDIVSLLENLTQHRMCVEEWLPKATMPGKGVFDVRALAIAGKMRHVVGRCSHTPITNLHLLNQRVSAEEVRARVGEGAWAMLEETVERVATVYPRSLHLGIDIMWTPGFRQCYVLEVNAFGDQLNDVLCDGESTYTAEIRAWEKLCAER